MRRIDRVRGGRYRRFAGSGAEDTNPKPSDGSYNLLDAFVVVIVGVIVSVVSFWNIELTSNSVVPVKQGVENAGVSEEAIPTPDEESGLEEVGIVYRDPVTGNLYMSESTADEDK